MICKFTRLPFLVLVFCALANTELFSAVAELENLLQTEAVIIDNLEKYISTEEQRLDLLKRYAVYYQSEHDRASEDAQKYLANPINAYLLVKRLTTYWKQLEELISIDAAQDFIASTTHSRESLKFPSDEDLDGAVMALMRLQDTYQLDTASLASGELQGVQYGSELTAVDCFELGRQSYNNDDYYHTLLWMREAEERLVREASKTVDRSDILEYLAFSTYKQGNVDLALDLTNKLLEILPAHQRALDNIVYFKSEIEKLNDVRRNETNERNVGTIDDFLIEMKDSHKDGMTKYYQKMCRGEVTTPVEVTSKLKCSYATNNNPYLLIAPFKMEEAYQQPKIVIYYDVITDKEIETIKKISQPKLQRARVVSDKEPRVSHVRVSKMAWLEDHEHKYIKDVSQRVEDMTGLTMATAEQLQVANYGIGGHYEPHYDSSTGEKSQDLTDDRIATVIFYMSDVELGGATVFTTINVTVWPKKGSAAFWYNLHSSGHTDSRTKHGGCPVLAGSKWAANKWIQELGQEFRRPCELTPPSPDVIAS